MRRVVQRVVEPRQHPGRVAKGRVRRDVLDPLAVDPDLAAVAQALEELLAGVRPRGPVVSVVIRRSSGGDGRPHLGGDQVEQLEHAPEIVAAEVDHQVREAESLVLAEEIGDRLRTLPNQIVAQGEAAATS